MLKLCDQKLVALDWTQSQGQKTGSYEIADVDSSSSSTPFESYTGGVRLGGASENLQKMLSPREMALIAAQQRLSKLEQELEDHCGNQTKTNANEHKERKKEQTKTEVQPLVPSLPTVILDSQQTTQTDGATTMPQNQNQTLTVEEKPMDQVAPEQSCPICGFVFKQMSNLAINKHIDTCLSK